MKFKLWIENESREVAFARLYGWRSKVLESIQEVQSGSLSYTQGPVRVSRLDSPRGSFFVLDGHHRIIEAILAGQRSVPIIIDEYMPRIERTGGGHREMVAQKVLILQAVKEVMQ